MILYIKSFTSTQNMLQLERCDCLVIIFILFIIIIIIKFLGMFSGNCLSMDRYILQSLDYSIHYRYIKE